MQLLDANYYQKPILYGIYSKLFNLEYQCDENLSNKINDYYSSFINEIEKVFNIIDFKIYLDSIFENKNIEDVNELIFLPEDNCRQLTFIYNEIKSDREKKYFFSNFKTSIEYGIYFLYNFNLYKGIIPDID